MLLYKINTFENDGEIYLKSIESVDENVIEKTSSVIYYSIYLDGYATGEDNRTMYINMEHKHSDMYVACLKDTVLKYLRDMKINELLYV